MVIKDICLSVASDKTQMINRNGFNKMSETTQKKGDTLFEFNITNVATAKGIAEIKCSGKYGRINLSIFSVSQ
jgi:hypothetical protein